MLKYILKRILIMIPILLVVIVATFTITYYMPGDPVRTMLGPNYTEEQYNETMERLGLNEPFFVQLWNYIKNLVTKFDFGTSYQTSRSVNTELGSRIWESIRIGLMSCLLTTAIAIPIGIISAVKQNSIVDYIVSFFSILVAALPNFWVALMAIIVFCINLGWLPATAQGGWLGYILPVVCNGTLSLAIVTRQTRSSMLDVIRQDYIRTARAKGLSESKTIIKHGLKNAMLPVLTVLGTQFSMIIGGSVVIESIFSVPGMGSRLVTAINGRDYPVVLSITILISAFSMMMILLVDIMMSLIDPRVKAQFSGRRKKRKKVLTAVLPTEAVTRSTESLEEVTGGEDHE